MHDASSPTGGTDPTRVTARRLAEILGLSPATVKALAGGEITAPRVVAEWPTGGIVEVGDDESLERRRQCQRDVDRFGRDVVKEAELRERSAAADAAMP
jgi:hypothetical protein